MIEHIALYTLPAMNSLLPAKLRSVKADAELLAIGLQESRFLHRRQMNFGPAHGFWQFELPGVREVMRHPSSRDHARDVLRRLRYAHFIGHKAETSMIRATLEHNDVLAAAFARLYLYTHPDPLPTREQPLAGWQQYIETWRPGRPHQATWLAYYTEAWDRLDVAGRVPVNSEESLQ